MSKLIDFVETSGLANFLPDVEPAKKVDKTASPEEKKRNFESRLWWTMMVLLVYLVCSQLPLYGIDKTSKSDPFYILRMILASRGGTLMELGITPIITAGMIMQLLAGAGIITFDQSNQDDRRKFASTSKVLGIAICLGEATAYVMTGSYGPVGELGLLTSFLIIVQLFIGGLITLTLEEVLNKGHGLATGINLFIVTNICEGILWRCFSPTTFNAGNGTEFEGCIIALFHGLVTRSNKLGALYYAFFRENLPNVMNLLATLFIFLLVIFVQGLKVVLPLQLNKEQQKQVPRGWTPPPDVEARMKHPIKLFYTSNMPIILLSALTANLFFFSSLLFRRYPGNILVRLLGQWEQPRYGSQRPTGGLSYYLAPPQSFAEVLGDPFHFLFYVVFMLSASAMFAKVWLEVSGSGAAAEEAKIKAQGLELVREGRDRKENPLRKYIPTAAAFGGMAVAALSIFADLLGAIGSGTGILMAVTIIYDIFEAAAESLNESEMALSGWVGSLFGTGAGAAAGAAARGGKRARSI